MKIVSLRSGDLSGGRCYAVNDASLLREENLLGLLSACKSQYVKNILSFLG